MNLKLAMQVNKLPNSEAGCESLLQKLIEARAAEFDLMGMSARFAEIDMRAQCVMLRLKDIRNQSNSGAENG